MNEDMAVALKFKKMIKKSIEHRKSSDGETEMIKEAVDRLFDKHTVVQNPLQFPDRDFPSTIEEIHKDLLESMDTDEAVALMWSGTK